jgi:photosystem II stability/assembly factor-like uncharacterized protein
LIFHIILNNFEKYFKQLNQTKMKNIFTFSVMLVVLITSSSNSQWSNQNSGTAKTLLSMYFIDANTGVITGDSSLFMKTSNGGTNWVIMPPPGGSNNYYAGVYMQNANNIYLTQGYYGGISGYGEILHSTNGGNNWTLQLLTQSDMISIAFINANTGFAVGNGNSSIGDSLYKTTNGSSWTAVNVGYIGFMTYIYFYNASTGFICSNNSGNILRTSNGGVNWSVVATSTVENRVNQILMVDANTCYGVTDNETFLKSTNGGLNWTSQSFGNSVDGISIGFTSASTGFMVTGKESTSNYKITKTTNAGSNWTTVLSGTSKLYWAIGFVNSSTGWIVGSSGSILKTTNGGGVWVQNISTAMPDKYDLYQNYPNPFNPTTNIKYQITNNGFVNLKVFDINGKEVSTLVNEKQNAGTYEATFDASELSSGIYFYQLTAGNYIKTMKMVLVK